MSNHIIFVKLRYRHSLEKRLGMNGLFQLRALLVQGYIQEHHSIELYVKLLQKKPHRKYQLVIWLVAQELFL